MKTSCYLLVDKRGNVELRKTSYTSKFVQIPIKINIIIPDSAFKERIIKNAREIVRAPLLSANLEITEDQFDQKIKELELELKLLKED